MLIYTKKMTLVGLPTKHYNKKINYINFHKVFTGKYINANSELYMCLKYIYKKANNK